MIPNVSLSALKPGDAVDPKAIAAKVQGMFMEEMLKAMENTVDAEDGLFGRSASAVADGRVIESGVRNGYGNTVVIQTDDGRKMLYGHNNQNFVQVGDRVSRSEQIAEVGSTGRATGPHVHFEIKF